VRTPLNAILGTAQLMETQEGRSSEDCEKLRTIEKSVSYLIGIFSDILETSRISAGRVTIRPVPTEEHPFLEGIISLVLNQAEQKGIALTASIPGTANRTLLIDADHVTRILVNLIGNAVKYTPEGGKVDFLVATRKLRNGKIRHEYTITDNGNGMSEAFQEKMYEPFEQEAELRRDHIEGQGLGLFIVKKLVEGMGGKIKCVSTPNCGTTFTVSIDYKTAAGLPETNAEKLQPKALQGKRVLICEDQSINAEIATQMLSRFGMERDLAVNGREGVEMFCASAPGYYDAILMDLRMPVMDGRDATVAIRAKDRPDAQTVPILMMTADVFVDDRTDLLRAGANDFVYKPVNMNELYKTLCHNLLPVKPNETEQP
jgi:CheY-like chemotaxis protein